MVGIGIIKHPEEGLQGSFGADDGSRTHPFGLGSQRSTDELHLHVGKYSTGELKIKANFAVDKRNFQD